MKSPFRNERLRRFLRATTRAAGLCGFILMLSTVAFAAPIRPGVPVTPPAAPPQSQYLTYLPMMARELPFPSVALVDPIGGFDRPVHVTNAGDGSNRLFVVEQKGRIMIVRNGVRLPTPFLDIRDRVSCCGERGLFSVAFPPGYATKGHFYVAHTDAEGDLVVKRYRVTADPDVAAPSSEQLILEVDHPVTVHFGGQLAFGPDDGYLYVGLGDGGDAGDPANSAQNPRDPLGKIFRIDVESGVAPYAIPPDNPFVANPAYLPEIWALGVRNPWRFSFDRLTADLYIGDVGQNLYEEVDYQAAGSPGGENYGWRLMEGDQCFGASTCDRTGLTLPVVTYDHYDGNCSVTGGMVYRGAQQPALSGLYLYGDFCSGRIWGLRRDGAGWKVGQLHQQDLRIVSFGEDEQGEVYLADLRSGSVYRIAVTP